jgi:hypothetical protein
MKQGFAGLLVAGVVLGLASGASAQVVIQGEGQAGGVYGQGSVYVAPAQGQQQVVVQQSPYVASQQQVTPQQRTIVHRSSTNALLVPGVIALGAGWLIHGLGGLGILQNCYSDCPTDSGLWAGLGWIPVVGPWLAYGLADEYGSYSWFNILFGVIQDVGLILMVLGIAIQQEWEEVIYADLGNDVTLSFAAGPTSVGAALHF